MRDIRLVRLGAMVIAGLFFATLFAGLATPVGATQPTSWTTMPSFGGNRSQAAVVTGSDGLIYIMGGFDSTSTNPVDHANSYNPKTGEWRDLAHLPVAVRGAAAAADTGGKIYVFGGQAATVSAVTQIYDIASDNWTMGASMPAVRWEANAVYVNSYIYLAGGYQSGSAQSTLWYYSPSSDSWTVRPAMPSGRYAGALLAIDSDLYYIGGLSGVATAQSDVYHFNIYSSTSWDSIASLPEARGAMGGVVGPDGVMYVFGGGTSWDNIGTCVATGYYYSWSNGTWASIPDLPAESRYMGAVATNDGRIWCLGGSNSTSVLASVFSLQVADYQMTLAPSSVGQGQSVTATITPDFAYVSPTGYYTYAYVVGPDDVVYSSTGSIGMGPSVYVPVGLPFTVTIQLPQTAVAGNYTFVLTDLEFGTSMTSGALEGKNATFSVVAAPSTQDQIDALQSQVTLLQDQLSHLQSMVAANDTAMAAQITALQAQVTALQNQISSLQDKANQQVDSATGTIILVIGIISIILMVVVIVLVLRKK